MDGSSIVVRSPTGGKPEMEFLGAPAKVARRQGAAPTGADFDGVDGVHTRVSDRADLQRPTEAPRFGESLMPSTTSALRVLNPKVGVLAGRGSLEPATRDRNRGHRTWRRRRPWAKPLTRWSFAAAEGATWSVGGWCTVFLGRDAAQHPARERKRHVPNARARGSARQTRFPCSRKKAHAHHGPLYPHLPN